MQPTNGLIIELLDSREAMWWFVDRAIIDDMIHGLYFAQLQLGEGSAPILYRKY